MSVRWISVLGLLLGVHLVYYLLISKSEVWNIKNITWAFLSMNRKLRKLGHCVISHKEEAEAHEPGPIQGNDFLIQSLRCGGYRGVGLASLPTA